MKKFLVFMVMLAVLTVIWSAEDGTMITRDNSAGLTRFKVVNRSTNASSQSGFIAANQSGNEVVVYIECAADGADMWIRSGTGDMYANVPTGKQYYWNINDVETATLGASGFTGTWVGTDVGVAYGGTGVSSLTDGGVLLGSNTGAITPMAVLGDGYIIVGDNATDPVPLKAFSSSTGDLVYEAGGLEDDLSGYAGLIKITGQVTSNITDKAGLQGCMSDVTDFAEASGDTYAGDHNFTSAFLMGTSPLKFEGVTDDAFSTVFQITDPTDPGRTIIFQNANGTVVTDGTACYNIDGDNLSITGGTLNAAWASGSVTIDSTSFVYFHADGATGNDFTGNWRLCHGDAIGVDTTNLIWQYCTDGGVPTWVTKETKAP